MELKMPKTRLNISNRISNEDFLAHVRNHARKRGLMNQRITVDLHDVNGKVLELFKVFPKRLESFIAAGSKSKKDLKWAVQKLYVPTLSTIKE
jgi:hypothetical protein